MDNKEKLNMFLKELSELSNKYKLVICGCGCCGSPWIEDVDVGEIANYLLFNDGKYKSDFKSDLMKF